MWGRSAARFVEIDFKGGLLDGYDVDWPYETISLPRRSAFRHSHWRTSEYLIENVRRGKHKE
ncbi:MAG TPA: hypothetical protein VFL34_13070 [Candidatus Sulfotelmatobacter sp.]|nr:hypothetical protein [Candidatus Sulfotelmatobacter sp.]